MNSDRPFPQRDEQHSLRYKSWFRCHGCGKEYPLSDGIRGNIGCNNPCCYHSDIHLHSNADGEIPRDEYVRIMSVITK